MTKRKEATPKISRKQLLEVTAANLKTASDTLRVHEIKWKEEWDAAPNPFIALDRFMANKPNRVKIINQWLTARREYDEARS